MIKVCFIVGDNKTRHCGVKDYSRTLAVALSQAGVQVKVLAADSWSIFKVLPFLRFLRKNRFDVLHVQYPSIGFRASLVPHFLGWMGIARKSVVTIHEYSALPQAQQLCAQLFRWTSNYMLFVSEFEKSAFQKQLKAIGPAQAVLPIGSNVPKYQGTAARKPIVLYFGQIRPNKGIEDFLALVRLSKEASLAVRFVIAGSYPERQKAYFESLVAAAPAEVEWLLDQPFEVVAELMATSLAAYLPFPDGASQRRGSLLACLVNGLPVISRTGPASGDLADILLIAEKPVNALEHVQRLLAHLNYSELFVDRTQSLSRKFEWPQIAAKQREIYELLLVNRQRTEQHGNRTAAV